MKPVEIDLSKVSFDGKHINKERKRNVTLDGAKTIIKNVRFSETVWIERFELYYSVDGVVYVNEIICRFAQYLKVRRLKE